MRGENGVQPQTYTRLVQYLAGIADLHRACAVLEWDELTRMPPGGVAARGNQTATLRRLAHASTAAPELASLLSALEPYERDLSPDSDEAALIRVTRRDHARATRVPVDLVAEHARAAVDGYQAWLRAREENRFAVFRPALERVVAVMGRIASALGYSRSPLDPLIDLTEPGVTTADCVALFDALRPSLLNLVRTILGRAPMAEASLLRGHFDPGRQLACGLAAVRAIGFDTDRRGRVDLSVHPFTTGIAPGDTRITTRVDPEDFSNCFYSLLHEAGHGLYEQGLPVHLARTPLGGGASAGVHESQSRLWENMVGRSEAFWVYFLPVAREFFPAPFGEATPAGLYRAVNAVGPSLIRTEADEVTYNLHVMLRFELEQEVLGGRLAVADLRDAWNQKLAGYLGVTPPDDRTGVLQDIHWSGSFGGCFQGYTLGNAMAGQLLAAVRSDYPTLDEDLARGRFAGLREWLGEAVHRHGARYEPLELIRRATGRPLTAGPYLNYLHGKFTELYGL